MGALIKYLYENEPRPITIGYSIILRPLNACLAIMSLLLLLPGHLLLFCVPAFLYILFALISYSSIFKAYYQNRVAYCLYIAVWVCALVFLFRPLIHQTFQILVISRFFN